jgi:hypothetical protein
MATKERFAAVAASGCAVYGRPDIATATVIDAFSVHLLPEWQTNKRNAMTPQQRPTHWRPWGERT